MKKISILLFISIFIFSACNSNRAPAIQSFEPIPIDLEKINQKDYTELISIVDRIYGGSNNIFNYATVIKEETTYLYLRVYSSIDESCYRVSIDRNRSKAVNVQPDCSVSVE